jgi:hypothetical protein
VTVYHEDHEGWHRIDWRMVGERWPLGGPAWDALCSRLCLDGDATVWQNDHWVDGFDVQLGDRLFRWHGERKTLPPSTCWEELTYPSAVIPRVHYL